MPRWLARVAAAGAVIFVWPVALVARPFTRRRDRIVAAAQVALEQHVTRLWETGDARGAVAAVQDVVRRITGANRIFRLVEVEPYGKFFPIMSAALFYEWRYRLAEQAEEWDLVLQMANEALGPAPDEHRASKAVRKRRRGLVERKLRALEALGRRGEASELRLAYADLLSARPDDGGI